MEICGEKIAACSQNHSFSFRGYIYRLTTYNPPCSVINKAELHGKCTILFNSFHLNGHKVSFGFHSGAKKSIDTGKYCALAFI